MEEYKVKILGIEALTHDVKRYILNKPPGYRFIPGQATEISLNLPGWTGERRPFTFTGLNDWDHLEFTIKSYRERDGVTRRLDQLQPGHELLIHEVWGAIQYKGPGLFIAGGAGITPFIAILRELNREGEVGSNRLIFSNKTREDIIGEGELRQILGDRMLLTLTRSPASGYYFGRVDRKFLEEHAEVESGLVYLCGPDPMVRDLQLILSELGMEPTALIMES